MRREFVKFEPSDRTPGWWPHWHSVRSSTMRTHCGLRVEGIKATVVSVNAPTPFCVHCQERTPKNMLGERTVVAA